MLMRRLALQLPAGSSAAWLPSCGLLGQSAVCHVGAAGPDGTTPLGGLLAASLQRLIHGDSGEQNLIYWFILTC